MSPNPPLTAQIASFKALSEKISNGLTELKRSKGIDLVMREDGLYCEWKTLDEAISWCSKMSVDYPDNGYLMGEETDSLIQAYRFFRINEGFYFIILAIINEEIFFNENSWKVSELADIKTREHLNSLLLKYEMKV